MSHLVNWVNPFKFCEIRRVIEKVFIGCEGQCFWGFIGCFAVQTGFDLFKNGWSGFLLNVGFSREGVSTLTFYLKFKSRCAQQEKRCEQDGQRARDEKECRR